MRLKELLEVVSGLDCYVNDKEVGYFTSSENSYAEHMIKYLNYKVEYIWVVDSQQQTIIQCDLKEETK